MRRFAWCIPLAITVLTIWAASLPAAGPATAAAKDGAASVADWPQWRGPDRNGISPETITWPAGGPKQLWKMDVGKGFSAVSISQGRAYTMGDTDDIDAVWCLDANTGAVIWKHTYPCKNPDLPYPGPRSTPIVDGKFVYTVSYSGQLLALNIETGQLVWSVDYIKDFGSKIHNTNRHGFAGSPLVDGDLLLANVGGPGASVVAFNKTTGKVVWKSGDDPASFASPMIFTLGAQRMVAMFSGTGLYSYNLADGKPLWNIAYRNSDDINAADPILMGDQVFITNGQGAGAVCALVKITDHSAAEVYHNKNLISHCECPVLVGGFVYGFTGYINTSKMVCLDPKTGGIKWKNDKLGGAIIAAGSKLLIQSLDGNLVVAEASPDSYKEIGRVQALSKVVGWKGHCWVPPSLAHGLVYCRSMEGELVCLDLSGK